MDDYSDHALAATSHLGVFVSAEEVKQAVLQGKGLGTIEKNGRVVQFQYTPYFALTANCLNGHIRDVIGMREGVMKSSDT